MAATVEFRYFSGASIGSGASAESGFKFNREDTISGTTPVPIPTATGTNYSFYKVMGLYVTATGGTLSNYTIKANSAQPTGIYLYFKAVAAASYVQAATGNQVAAGGTNGAVPATYTLMTTTAQQWDATGASAGTTGQKGLTVWLLLGVGYDYVSGGNSNLALSNMTVTYDEA